METLKTVVAILAICTNFYQPSCGGAIEIKINRRVLLFNWHEIHFRNRSTAYGKALNYFWLLDFIKGYALQLNVTRMSTSYNVSYDDRKCRDFGRLIINGEQVDCLPGIAGIDLSPAKYYQFYNDPSCANMDCSFYCENKINTQPISFIIVEYFADGSKPINTGPDEMWGFRIRYKYVKCRRDTETVGRNPPIIFFSKISLQKPRIANRTTATTKKPTTTSALPTARPSIQTTPISATSPTTSPPPQPKSNNHLSSATVSSTSSRVEWESRIPINNQEDSKPNNPLLYGLISGGIALLILIVIIICIVRKRNEENKTGKSGSSMDPAVVYTAVNKSAKTPKTERTQYAEVAEDSQSDDAGHAPMNTPVVYAVVNKSSKSSEREVPTYAQVDKSAKSIDKDNDQSEPASDATPTNRPPVYATVEIHDGGIKRTVH